MLKFFSFFEEVTTMLSDSTSRIHVYAIASNVVNARSCCNWLHHRWQKGFMNNIGQYWTDILWSLLLLLLSSWLRSTEVVTHYDTFATLQMNNNSIIYYHWNEPKCKTRYSLPTRWCIYNWWMEPKRFTLHLLYFFGKTFVFTWCNIKLCECVVCLIGAEQNWVVAVNKIAWHILLCVCLCMLVTLFETVKTCFK